MFNIFARKKKPLRSVVTTNLRATRFDGASYETELHDHWKFTDGRSIDNSLDPDTRRRLRERSRYEIANNSIAARAAKLVVGDVVGTGVRLQMTLATSDGKLNKALNQEIEDAFNDWAQEVRLSEKLAAMRFARFQDGEAFAILFNNNRLETKSGVKLDLALIDAERVCSDTFNWRDDESSAVRPNENETDGIEFDKYGNPTRYRILRKHPGGNAFSFINEADWYDASRVIHWFERQQPEQHRGIPELTPCLNVLARFSRYQKAVLSAAETAANLALMLYTDLSPSDIDALTPDEVKAFPERPGMSFPIGEGTSWALPAGFKPSQLKAEQPSSTYGDFSDRLLTNIGGALGIPQCLITNSANGTTYAGGRLEEQSYFRYVKRDQKNLDINVVKPIFREWYKEFALLWGLSRELPPYECYHDGFEHIDPLKDANSQAVLLGLNATTLAEIYGRVGRDWENELEQRCMELRKIKELEKKYDVSFTTAQSTGSQDDDATGGKEGMEQNAKVNQDNSDWDSEASG